MIKTNKFSARNAKLKKQGLFLVEDIIPNLKTKELVFVLRENLPSRKKNEVD